MIRKLVPVVFLIFIFCEQGLAQKQDEPPRGHFGILFGPSFPTGTFALKEWDNDQSGYAKNGYQYSAIDFGIKFVPNFGIAAAFKGTYIPMDVQYLANRYAETYGGQFEVTSTRWKFGGIFAGPFLSIPSRYVDVDFRFMPGLMLAFSPEINVSRFPQTITQESSVGPSIAFSLNAGVRIHLSNKLSGMLQAEYQTAMPTFVIEQNDGTNFESVRATQKINIINLSAGIALRIFKKN